MRRIAVISLFVITACTPVQEPAATSLSQPPPSTSAPGEPSTVPATSTTAVGREEPATTTSTSPGPLKSLAYRHIADLPFPVQMTARSGEDIAYVITKDGVVWSFEDGAVSDTPVMDISDRVRNRGEQGLLSIALDPTMPTRMVLHYTAVDGDTVVSEFTLDSPHSADPGSERVLLRLDQPAGNHNGGMLQFYEGTLYLGLGDGGGGGDQFGNGQNTDTLLGGIVALDVDGGDEPSLYMSGLRNPWRFWIDGGIVYIADVGQNAYEEITVTEMASGQNLGWPVTEGLHCFRPASGCDTNGLTLADIEVAHGDAGTCSITGGVVYRGGAIPELWGAYLYSDYCGGYLRSLRWSGEVSDQEDLTDQVGIPGQVVSFGIDGAGEIYVMTTSALFELVAER